MPDYTPADRLDLDIEVLLAGGNATGLTELAEVAAQLLLLPDESFRERLKSDLKRRVTMPATATQIREGFRTVTPYITIAEADKFVDFLKQTFDAVEVARIPHGGPDGFHSEVRIGDSMLMVGPAERGHEAPAILHIYVSDCDATCARALAAGARSIGEPADRPYGERSGYATAFGNTLYIATRFTSDPESKGYGDIFPYLHPRKARPYIEFLTQAFGAEALGIHEQDGRVMHAKVRIGNSLVEMGEPVDAVVTTGGFFMYVEDVDTVYARAIAAGATSLRPPTDEPAGHRGAALRDPSGYTWYAATLL